MTRETATNDDFASNDVRLSPREWLVAGVIFAAIVLFVPRGWQAIEPIETGPDCRVPYALADDYWLYQRGCRQAYAEDKILVVGDSVVWGHYVAGDRTLSHYLNELSDGPRFANLGLDGTHPAALEGLVRYYSADIRDKRVILFCNPLWMSSPKHDLQDEDHGGSADPFNHPRLVPQFTPRVPCYRESLEGRLGIVVQRQVPFLNWAQHLRTAYFNNEDLAAWAKQRPYQNPLAQITLRLPGSVESPVPKAVSWTAGRIAQFNPPWVELGESYQWDAFRRTVALLQSRGNRVFVLVGPFNEHMLKPESRTSYRRLKAEIAAWLTENGVPHFAPEVLPSDLYADASHPLGEGYALIAQRLMEYEAFAAFCEGD